jgi:CII-binding regulator of phage lambda lysogenization HflD
MEEQTEYFTPDFYRKIINDKGIFDSANLLDIAAIYGQSNHKQVKTLIENVFEIEPKLLVDLKESFDMMLNIMKRIFKDALRTDQMIQGDSIL